jgi:hypothetical protein
MHARVFCVSGLRRAGATLSVTVRYMKAARRARRRHGGTAEARIIERPNRKEKSDFMNAGILNCSGGFSHFGYHFFPNFDKTRKIGKSRKKVSCTRKSTALTPYKGPQSTLDLFYIIKLIDL